MQTNEVEHPTLELGVDVGCLDATIHMGFPGSVSSLWQQAGRAGRGGRPSTAIMVAFDSPLDQLMMRAPEENLLNLPPDTTTLPNDNEYVLREHLLCAAAFCRGVAAVNWNTFSRLEPHVQQTAIASSLL